VSSLIAGVAILLLLAMAFHNMRNLTLVLANLPFALAGGVLAIFFSGGWLTLGFLVGVVTVFGISTRNSIMVISNFARLVGADSKGLTVRLWDSSSVFKVGGLSKRFGRFYALQIVGFELRAGEISGLIGPNGAGKRTLFECLAGVASGQWWVKVPENGSVKVPEIHCPKGAMFVKNHKNGILMPDSKKVMHRFRTGITGVITIALLGMSAGSLIAFQRAAAAPARQGYAELLGVRLWFTDTGGSGIPVVLLHANTGNSDSWQYNIPAFEKA